MTYKSKKNFKTKKTTKNFKKNYKKVLVLLLITAFITTISLSASSFSIIDIFKIKKVNVSQKNIEEQKKVEEKEKLLKIPFFNGTIKNDDKNDKGKNNKENNNQNNDINDSENNINIQTNILDKDSLKNFKKINEIDSSTLSKIQFSLVQNNKYSGYFFFTNDSDLNRIYFRKIGGRYIVVFYYETYSKDHFIGNDLFFSAASENWKGKISEIYSKKEMLDSGFRSVRKLELYFNNFKDAFAFYKEMLYEYKNRYNSYIFFSTNNCKTNETRRYAPYVCKISMDSNTDVIDIIPY